MKYNDYDKYQEYDEYNEYMDEDQCVDDKELEPCEDYAEYKDFKKKKRMIEVEEVLGIGSAETIVEICVPLRPPAFEVVKELITKEVEFDALVASKGKVFVNGRVIKDIPYKTKERVCAPSCPAVSKATYGNLRHVTVEVPFALCIDIPEAHKGDKVVVLDFDVNSIEIPNHTNCIPNSCVAQCEPKFLKKDPCNKRLFCSLTEKDCISVKVKVVKDTIIWVPEVR